MGKVGRWSNMDLYGNEKSGTWDPARLARGDNPEALVESAMDNIADCYLREIGRPPRRMELELLWRRILERKMPINIQRCLESEIL